MQNFQLDVETGSERIVEPFGDDVWNLIDDIFHTVTREIIEYAESIEMSGCVFRRARRSDK
jgi:hypothetical protein